jgi:hypothetical protein
MRDNRHGGKCGRRDTEPDARRLGPCSVALRLTWLAQSTRRLLKREIEHSRAGEAESLPARLLTIDAH